MLAEVTGVASRRAPEKTSAPVAAVPTFSQEEARMQSVGDLHVKSVVWR
jgi:hypothetical protein